MAVKLLQDIHLSDKELWSNFQDYWDSGNYVAAINLLNANQQLVTKYVSANWLNGLTALVYALENNSDPTFKADRILLSYIPPSLEIGQVYFQLEVFNTIINVSIGAIDTTHTSNIVSFNGTFINAMAFQDLQQVDTDIQLSGSTATFSVAEEPDKTITCIVFSSSDVVRSIYNLYSPNTSATINFTGTLLSAIPLVHGVVTTCDISISNNQAVFSIDSALSGTNILCCVITVDTDYITEGEINVDTDIISTSSTSATLDCDGYLINHILTQSNNIIKTDVELVGAKVVISTAEQPSSPINATVYYT